MNFKNLNQNKDKKSLSYVRSKRVRTGEAQASLENEMPGRTWGGRTAHPNPTLALGYFFHKCDTGPFFEGKCQNTWSGEKKLRGAPELRGRGHVQEK